MLVTAVLIKQNDVTDEFLKEAGCVASHRVLSYAVFDVDVVIANDPIASIVLSVAGSLA